MEYLEGREEDDGKVYNWVMRPGKVRITYVDGSTFEGSVNDERMKHGKGVYQWKKPGGEGEEEPVVKATYEGEYWNGKRQGRGKMVFPSGDTYHGEWKDNKVSLSYRGRWPDLSVSAFWARQNPSVHLHGFVTHPYLR